jgi:hypothetical protein
MLDELQPLANPGFRRQVVLTPGDLTREDRATAVDHDDRRLDCPANFR